MRAVSNAGPLIHLSWIDHLDLLATLFDEILVPPAVQDEVLRASPDVLGVPALRAAFTSDWLKVQAVTNRSAVTQLTTDLDLGEAEATVLAREVAADLLLLDERRGRGLAEGQGLPIMGTIGILGSTPPKRGEVAGSLKRMGPRCTLTNVNSQSRSWEAARGPDHPILPQSGLPAAGPGRSREHRRAE